jgi:hypothetical protein
MYLSWKNPSSVGVPQLEVSVLLSGIALSVILATDVVSLWSFSSEYTGTGPTIDSSKPFVPDEIEEWLDCLSLPGLVYMFK